MHSLQCFGEGQSQKKQWKHSTAKSRPGLRMSTGSHHQTAKPCRLNAFGVGRNRLCRCYALPRQAWKARNATRLLELELVQKQAELRYTKSLKHHHWVKSLQAFCNRTNRWENAELLRRSPGSGIPDTRTLSVGTWLAWTVRKFGMRAWHGLATVADSGWFDTATVMYADQKS